MRQNKVYLKLAKDLRSKGYEIFVERSIHLQGTYCQPDLVPVKDRKATLLDVGCLFEKDNAYILRVEAGKEFKYSRTYKAFPEHLRRALGVYVDEFKPLGIAIGAAGTILEHTVLKLKTHT